MPRATPRPGRARERHEIASPPFLARDGRRPAATDLVSHQRRIPAFLSESVANATTLSHGVRAQ
ncbi:hypothetical protein C4900_13545 [Acidiferrobacter thiooxydans]|uniref:Uncharacterized protein n=1 Tax=Acidiferrobacter thiooxydans TaxID=163359 RepID=A0A368HHM2_9GAMM|nr:hypothetical protein C4900_13545 [Acidiferrobacter thiooxydans]